MTKVVNFYGGPGAGKSTMAGRLFGWMKAERMNVEYVPEFAKDLTWKKSGCLDDQLYVFAEQAHRLYVLKDQVDWILTDSPLLLSCFYVDKGMSKFTDERALWIWKDVFMELVWATYDMYDNVNILVERGDRKFIQAGRNQDEAESREIDTAVESMLKDLPVDYDKVSSLEEVIKLIMPSQQELNGV